MSGCNYMDRIIPPAYPGKVFLRKILNLIEQLREGVHGGKVTHRFNWLRISMMVLERWECLLICILVVPGIMNATIICGQWIKFNTKVLKNKTNPSWHLPSPFLSLKYHGKSEKDNSVPTYYFRNWTWRFGHRPFGDVSELFSLTMPLYVILERAVPPLKMVWNPCSGASFMLCSINMMGRYHKVANLIGQTMQYHRTAMLPLGMLWWTWVRKTCWSTVRETWGDFHCTVILRQPRYIEAHHPQVALDIAFNRILLPGRWATMAGQGVICPWNSRWCFAHGAEGIKGWTKHQDTTPQFRGDH